MTMDITSCDYIFLKLPGLSPDQLHALHLEVEAMNQTGFEVITSWEEKLKVKPKTTIISSELRDVDQPSGGYTVTLKVPVKFRASLGQRHNKGIFEMNPHHILKLLQSVAICTHPNAEDYQAGAVLHTA